MLQIKFEMMNEVLNDIDTFEFDSFFECNLYMPVHKIIHLSIFIEKCVHFN